MHSDDSPCRSRLARLDGSLGRWYPLALLVAIVAGVTAGEHLAPLRGWSPYLLASTMAAATSASRPEQFTLLLRRPSRLAGTLVVGWILVPGFAVGASRLVLGPSSPLHAGFSLLWIGPAAAVSSLWTQMAGGNVGLAVSLTATSVLAASLWLAPLFPIVYSGTHVMGATSVVQGLWGSTLTLVLVPAAAGAVVGARNPPILLRLKPAIGLAAKLSVLAIVCLNTSAVGPYLRGSVGPAATLAVLTAVAQALGHLAAERCGRWLHWQDGTDAVAVGYAGSTRNTVLAITLASLWLPPPAAMAPTIAFLVQEPLCALLAGLYRARRRSSLAGTEPARSPPLSGRSVPRGGLQGCCGPRHCRQVGLAATFTPKAGIRRSWTCRENLARRGTLAGTGAGGGSRTHTLPLTRRVLCR